MLNGGVTILSISFLTQIVLILLATLIFINASIYSRILCGIAFSFILSVSMGSLGIVVFSVVLMVVEVHVFYVVTCLTLTWSRYDTITSTWLNSSRNLNLTKVTLVVVLMSVLGSSTNVGYTQVSSTGLDYVYELLITQEWDLLCKVTASFNSIASALAFSYAVFSSFEFLILNVFMFVAVIAFFFIQRCSRRYMLSYEYSTVDSIVELYKTASYIFRQQDQGYQLKRDYATRCTTGNLGMLRKDSSRYN